MKNGAISLMLVCIGLCVGVSTGLIGVHYPRLIENDPLMKSIEVLEVSGSLVTLTDGRIYQWTDPGTRPTDDGFLFPGKRIDLEEWGPGEVVFFGTRRISRIGGAWGGFVEPLQIPLIPYDLDRYHRKLLGFGRLYNPSINAEQGGGGSTPISGRVEFGSSDACDPD